MAERYKVKITVLKRVTPEEVFGEYPLKGEQTSACSVYKDGQEFIVDESGRMPEGLCSWAWNDIYKVLNVLRFGGDFLVRGEGRLHKLLHGRA